MNKSIEPEAPKRKRLSHACNHCRSKKTRCDEQQPCRTCQLADVECITTDKRRNGAPVAQRRRTGAPASPHTQIRSNASNSKSPGSEQGHPRLWPQCWGRERWRTGRLPMMPRLAGASMLELTTEWLDLAFYRLKMQRMSFVSPKLNDLFAPFLLGAPDLPSPEETRGFIDSYFGTLHHLFPFLDRNTIEDIFVRNSPCRQSSSLDNEILKPSQLALMYLITVAGMIVQPASEESRSKISLYLGYCNSLLGHLVADRLLESVQAILLFSILLRSCDRIAWAWDVLAMGVSMAQSIGINHTEHVGLQPEIAVTNEEISHKTWWCMYVFERILAFEGGRPSMILDRGLTGVRTPPSPDSGEQYKEFQFQKASIGLANVLHELQERSARAWHREESLPLSVNEAIEEKLQTGGELIMLLNSWHNNLPTEYRLGATLTPGFDINPKVAFIAFYYNTAMIHLHRSTLLIDKAELHEVINKYASGKPWQQQLLNSSVMIIEAARDLVRLLVMLVDSRSPSYLTTLASPLNAICALAVHIIRERKSLLIRSDYELMKVAMQLTRQSYSTHGTVSNVDQVLSGLEHYTVSLLEGRAPDSAQEPNNNSTVPFNDESFADSEDASFAMMMPSWGPSSLDWIGWDWNDLSHLLEQGE